MQASVHEIAPLYEGEESRAKIEEWFKLPQRIRVARSYYERYVTLENTGHAPAGGACIRGRAAGTTRCNTQPF
jgi:hypothetical protein